MQWTKLAVLLVVVGMAGCGKPKTVITDTPLKEEQKKAIQAEDAKIAEQESHGTKKK